MGRRTSDDLFILSKLFGLMLVKLDPYYTQEPCFGQEQVVDVELDKNTILMPRTDGYVPVGSRSLWDLSHEEKGPPTSGGSPSGPGYREDDWHLPKGKPLAEIH